jgi:heme/copper-type cytochrome/quinol oxidase subunit 3
MADLTAPSAGSSAGSTDTATREAEENAFYHESALNAAWTGSRLAIGALSFLFGAFAFAYFYLMAANPNGMWRPKSMIMPHMWAGATITGLVVVSAAVQTVALSRLKGGAKTIWQQGAVVALLLGLAAVALQIWELLHLPFYPGSAGFASVFTGFYPVALVTWLCAMIWLEILIVRAAKIPAISFVEQPPTYTETFGVQRFQASLSSFTLVWNYLAVITFFFWLMFYVR